MTQPKVKVFSYDGIGSLDRCTWIVQEAANTWIESNPNIEIIGIDVIPIICPRTPTSNVYDGEATTVYGATIVIKYVEKL